MMGYGLSIGHAPSSSSSPSCSTLSPLAQPFTVDRSSALKPIKPAALPTAFDEHLNYRSSLDSWLQLHQPTSASYPIPSSRSDVDSIDGAYVYYGSSVTGSDGNRLPSRGSVGNGFSYGQKTGSTAASSLVDAEPFYPQYTPAISEKGELGIKESRLGLPKTGGATATVEASPSDYVQNLSGFGYNPVDWTGQLKEVESSWKSPSEKTLASNYGSSLQRESHATEGSVEESSGGIQRKDIQASIRKIYISSLGTGSEWPDIKCSGISDDDNPSSYKMSRASAMVPGSAFRQMPYTQLPDPTSPREAWNPYHQSPATYDISATEHETANPTIFYPHSMPYSSPAQAYSLPVSGPISTSVAASFKNMNPVGSSMELHDMKEAYNLSTNFEVPSVQVNAASKGIIDTRITNNKGDGFIFAGGAGYVSANVRVPDVQLNVEDGKESYSTRKNKDRREIVLGGSSPMNIDLAHLKAPKLVTRESSVYSTKSTIEQEHPHVWANRPTVKITMPVKPKEAVNNSLSQYLEATSEFEQCLMGTSPVKPSSALNLTPNADDSSNPSMTKPEQELPELKLPNFSSAPAAAVPIDTVQISSESFDQFVSAVDSPCWKGVSAFQRSPFAVADAAATLSVEKGLDGQSGLNQHCHISSLIDNDSVETISSPKHGCSSQTEAWCAEASFSTYQSGIQCSPSGKVWRNCNVITNNDLGCLATESLKKDVTSFQSSPKSGIACDAAQKSSMDFHSAAGECGSNVSSAVLSSVINEILGTSNNSSLQLLHIRMMVMMMFYASELLHNSSLLKEHDYEVLQLVVYNLQACLSKNDGLTKKVPQSFPLKDMKQVMEKNIHEQDEENPQASLYKNLWLEAEAALCSLKHELAHLKIKMEKYEQDLTKVELSLPSSPLSDRTAHILPLVKSIGVATDSNPPSLDRSEKSFNEKPSGVNEFTATSVDVYSQEAKDNTVERIAAVDHVDPTHPAKPVEVNLSGMKEKAESTSSLRMTETPTKNITPIGNNDCNIRRDLAELYQPIRVATQGVESSVMARFRVLKSRIDHLNSSSKEGLQKQPVPVVTEGVMPQCLGDKIDISKPWPFISDQSADRCLGVGNGYEEQCLLGYMDENCVVSDASRQRELAKSSPLHVADVPAIYAYTAGPLGSYFQAGGYESPSSDWEHVLKEDLKWP